MRNASLSRHLQESILARAVTGVGHWPQRRRPTVGAEGYGEIIEAATGDLVTPVLAAELAVRLSDLGISPAQGEG